jgi:esterase
VVFVAAGGTTVAEVSFQSLEHVAQRHRVIAPDYPPIDNLAEFFEDLIELLDQLGVGQFSAMGGSYGGWMVQSLVRHYPERVRKLVITVVGPPDRENSRQVARLMRWLRIAPTPLLRALINRSFARLVSNRSGDPDLVLLWALVREAMFYRLNRADILASLQRLVDQTQNYTFSSDDLRDWPGRILVMFGSEDPTTPPEKREAMRKLYPQAEVKVFEGGEHGIALSHQQEYLATIDEFLAQ